MTDLDYKALLNPAQIKRDLEVTALDLNTAMIRQPALFAHYAGLAARLDREVNKWEHFSEVLEAKLDREIRDNAVKEGIKYTETQIKSLCRVDGRMVKAQMKVNEAREAASIAKSTAEAFRHRRDMLVQLAFNYREENKGTMAIQGDPRARAAAEVRAARVEALNSINRQE